jgi:hypothetical protein
MANIKIEWTNPSDVTGVTGIKVLQKTGTNVPACADYLALNAVPTDNYPTGVTEVYASTSAPSVSTSGEVILQGLASGTYNFAVFAYNDVGFSPCSATSSTTTIS